MSSRCLRLQPCSRMTLAGLPSPPGCPGAAPCLLARWARQREHASDAPPIPACLPACADRPVSFQQRVRVECPDNHLCRGREWQGGVVTQARSTPMRKLWRRPVCAPCPAFCAADELCVPNREPELLAAVHQRRVHRHGIVGVCGATRMICTGVAPGQQAAGNGFH